MKVVDDLNVRSFPSGIDAPLGDAAAGAVGRTTPASTALPITLSVIVEDFLTHSKSNKLFIVSLSIVLCYICVLQGL